MDAEFVLIMALGMSAIVFLFMIMIDQSKRIDKQVRQKVTETITQAGGTVIEIVLLRASHGSLNVGNRVVIYIDAQERTQERYITYRVDSWGRLKGDIQWYKPSDVAQYDPHSSKEQIISEMDAEIRRLRGALAAVGTEDSPKSER